jgi:hypothetical protein
VTKTEKFLEFSEKKTEIEAPAPAVRCKQFTALAIYYTAFHRRAVHSEQLSAEI